MSEEVRGEKANEVVTDDVQDETLETTEPTTDEAETGEESKETLDVAEARKQALKEGLIGDSEETLDSEVARQRVENKRQSTQPTKPSTVDAFGRGGVAVAGPFGRRRVRSRDNNAKPAKPNNPRRGVQKIWEDGPINNVGQGTNTSDVRNKRKRDNDG